MIAQLIAIFILAVPKQMDVVCWKGPGQSIRVDREVDRKAELGEKLDRGV